jgi:hypothetical protein
VVIRFRIVKCDSPNRDERKRTDENFFKKIRLYLMHVYEKEQNKSPTPTSIKEAVNIHTIEKRSTCVRCVCMCVCVHAMKYFDKKNITIKENDLK